MGQLPHTIMQKSANKQTLYDRDFNLWISQQVALLKAGKLNAIDLENLIEEIEDMGRNNKNALKSYLLRLLEHLLKLKYWQAERDRNRNGWITEINNFRDQIELLLETSPSLKNYLKSIYSDRLAKAKNKVKKLFDEPQDADVTIEQAHDQDLFS